ncbi:MAG TPA: cysteine protease [Lentisphaeria bacterium]|nr:MAG: cysteine protease [Lentisphaerae bacterium GWF2_38_69]HBM15824.1 cysteine protease [Lentisphaeria bacterium]
MFLHVSSRLEFELSSPTPFIFILRPRKNDSSQIIKKEELKIHPRKKIFEYIDGFGNRCQRINAPKGKFSIASSADVITSDDVDIFFDAPFEAIQNLPNKIIPFLLPSRYCESDRLEQLAESIVEDSQSGYPQVFRICEWVRNYINYYPGSSYIPMTAIEVKDQGFGVCRDLAHLCIALCRGINIPARIAVGYLYKLEPMDLHAWFEAYVGGRWYTFDPVLPSPQGGRIVTAYGRDATDVAIYTNFGPPINYSTLETDVTLIED